MSDDVMRGHDGKPLPPELQAEIEALRAMSDDDIDCSDIPEVTDFTGWTRRSDRLEREVARVKRTFSVSLDAALVDYVEKAGAGSLDDRLNALLRDWVSNSKQATE